MKSVLPGADLLKEGGENGGEVSRRGKKEHSKEIRGVFDVAIPPGQPKLG